MLKLLGLELSKESDICSRVVAAEIVGHIHRKEQTDVDFAALRSFLCPQSSNNESTSSNTLLTDICVSKNAYFLSS